MFLGKQRSLRSAKNFYSVLLEQKLKPGTALTAAEKILLSARRAGLVSVRNDRRGSRRLFHVNF
jgi:hypothetical protein